MEILYTKKIGNTKIPKKKRRKYKSNRKIYKFNTKFKS